jgi:hypothetical protein
MGLKHHLQVVVASNLNLVFPCRPIDKSISCIGYMLCAVASFYFWVI